MPRSVTYIPPTISQLTSAPIGSTAKRKVAAYARVSTDHEEQQSSYEAQVDYYTNYIKGRDDWEFVSIYADEGVTGTSTKHREGFNAMVSDALAGKIDLIVTKSVSRFARNTVDSLTTIRKLKENGTEVYFEKESIWTFDAKGEMLLTILSSLSQEESRSISENVRWGQRKKFSDGRFSMPYSSFLGYDKGPEGTLVVNQDEAKIVERIFSLFLQGKTPSGIAKILTDEGVPTPTGRAKKWNSQTIRRMLQNEKYRGDALLQKTYTSDFLTKKTKVNHGEVPQYYVEGSHPAIIDPLIFDQVQAELKRRASIKKPHSGMYAFSSMIKCCDCGGYYGSKVWHSNDKYRKVIWRCNDKYKGDTKCSSPILDEAMIKEAFVRAANKALSEKDEAMELFRKTMEPAFDTSGKEAEAAEVLAESKIVSEMIEKLISRNAHTAMNQNEFRTEHVSLSERYESLKSRYDTLTEAISDKKDRKKEIEKYLDFLQSHDFLTEFDEVFWYAMVDSVTAYAKDDIRFTMRDGTEIKA